MDLRKGTVIFPIYQKSFGKLFIIRQPLAAAHAIAGVEQAIRLNGLQSFGFVLGLVLLPQNSARALPLTWKEDTDLLFTVGSVQDLEYHYRLLLTFVLHPEWTYIHTFGGGSGIKLFHGGWRGTMQLLGIDFRSLPSQYHLHSNTQLLVFLVYSMIQFLLSLQWN